VNRSTVGSTVVTMGWGHCRTLVNELWDFPALTVAAVMIHVAISTMLARIGSAAFFEQALGALRRSDAACNINSD
jgi:hypothetical protein